MNDKEVPEMRVSNMIRTVNHGEQIYWEMNLLFLSHLVKIFSAHSLFWQIHFFFTFWRKLPVKWFLWVRLWVWFFHQPLTLQTSSAYDLKSLMLNCQLRISPESSLWKCLWRITKIEYSCQLVPEEQLQASSTLCQSLCKNLWKKK